MPDKPRYGPIPPGLTLQYLIVLAGTDPLVWRRIRVPATYSFWDLHVAIQDAMGWQDCHLHQFRVLDPDSGTTLLLGIPDQDLVNDRSMSAGWTEFPIDYAMGSPPPMQYVYDFGDEWQHAVIFEDFDEDRRRKKPVCVAGSGACPPEDSGGPPGYADLLAALADPSHPNHDNVMEWTDGGLDPAGFSPNAVRFDDPKKRLRLALEGGAF